jgi:glutamyl-Q tRNA(Asp) synthetase
VSAVVVAPYRGRFAPSPTGPLHFGSLVAAMASYCDARTANGTWLVRIEDIDGPRARAGAADAILRVLACYGFRWDAPVVHQSARGALYARALDRLSQERMLFACKCTRRDLAAGATGPGGERVYPGTCRDLRLTPRARCALRVRVDAATIAFTDLLQGWQAQNLAQEIGDFVVRRADTLPAYQLAVVVDDAAQGVTTIVRGADLLASTPRQIHLQRLLGVSTPAYLHVPVAVTATGEKLSKQTGALALPDDPLPALLAAWDFLAQAAPPSPPASVEQFWRFAQVEWRRNRLPPVTMLPAPPPFAGNRTVTGAATDRV